MSHQFAGVFVNAVLVLDSTSGARIHAKYFAAEFAGAPEKQVSAPLLARICGLATDRANPVWVPPRACHVKT